MCVLGIRNVLTQNVQLNLYMLNGHMVGLNFIY